MLIDTCICGAAAPESTREMNGLQVRECPDCTAVHQAVPMTPAEYRAYYETDYHTGVQEDLGRPSYQARYDHDRSVAWLRLKEYGYEELATPILDIGCGNGAFVDELVDRGIDAVGLELAAGEAKPDRTYIGALEEQNFPAGHFGTVTMHDVLEHVVDPRAMLREIRRIMADGGRLIVDFPAFDVPEGLHHWRPVQHLWLLDPAQVARLLEDAGFRVAAVQSPIASKYVFYTTAKPVERPKLLLLPGIGDIYWTAVALAREDRAYLGFPRDTYIWNFDGRPRSAEYVKRFPFLRFAGYFDHPHEGVPGFRESYIENGRTIFKDFLGHDLYVSYNGRLRNGGQIQSDVPVDWYPPMWRPLAERKAEADARARHGRYFIVAVSDHGMFARWARAWPASHLEDMVRRIAHVTNATPVFTGSAWDAPYASRVARGARGVNLVGKTSLDELFGLIRGAQGVIGYPSGATIQSVVFKKPTLIAWSNYFPNAGFYRNCVPPDAWEDWYAAVTVERTRPRSAAERFVALMRRAAVAA